MSYIRRQYKQKKVKHKSKLRNNKAYTSNKPVNPLKFRRNTLKRKNPPSLPVLPGWTD